MISQYVTTIAGNGKPGYRDGTGTAARMYSRNQQD